MHIIDRQKRNIRIRGDARQLRQPPPIARAVQTMNCQREAFPDDMTKQP